jgi:tartronate-semialdehyde synthase
LHVYGPRQWINCARLPAGLTIPAALAWWRPTRRAPWSGLSGDYDFQFMVEEPAVGVAVFFRLVLCVQVLVNNSYPPDPPRASTVFRWISACSWPENQNVLLEKATCSYGVDHQVAGCKSLHA